MRHCLVALGAIIGICCLGAASAGPVRAGTPRAWSFYQRGDSDHRDITDMRVARVGTIHALQYLLSARGYKVAADGAFGRATDRAVRQFQTAHHLIPNGQTNQPFWEALVLPLKQGSAGPAVIAAQLRLEAYGLAVPPTGRFDAAMKTAVLKFQAQNGHTADGVIGPNTWNALLLGEAEGD